MTRFAIILVATLLAAGCDGGSGPDSTAGTASTTGPAPTTAAGPDAVTTATAGAATAEYLENFEFVWATIDEGFYDPGFGGLDWDAVHDRYLPQVTAADGDRAFLELMNSMLFELDVSHLFVLPPDADFVDPMLTTEGELGIHVRLLDGEWVITEVEPGSPAAEAGLRPGYLLDSVNDQPVTDTAASALPLPPLHERGLRGNQILAVEELLYGEPGAVITVGYRVDGEESQLATLTFRHRGPSAELIPGFPPVFTTLDVSRLEGGIGYIRFDPFAPALAAPILDAVDAMRDAPGLIIDVRGNHGGASDVGKQLIDSLVDEPALIWTFKNRAGSEDIYAEPSADPYDGPVVVLVDVASGSAAEALAGGIQAMGRAAVAGERTSGRLLGGEIVELPIGALMIYPITQVVTADGTIVEGRGVIPDIAVTVHRNDLLVGADPTLQAAVDYLLSSAD